MKRILILGGYGNAGRCIGEYLLKYAPGVSVTLAGRREEEALKAAASFAADYPGRAKGLRVDLADEASLGAALREADFVVNAAGGTAYTWQFCQRLLIEKKSALDIQLATAEKQAIVAEFAPHFAREGLVYITDGGFHPGLPAAMIRDAAAQFDEMTEGLVYSAIKIDWAALQFAPETLLELIGEFRSNRLAVYRDGKWEDQSVFKAFTYDFGPPFGSQYCAPMFLPELEDLAREMPALRRTGFFVTGFNAVSDYLALPLITMGVRLLPSSFDPVFARLLRWSLKFGKPPFGIELVADCRGQKDGAPHQTRLRIAHTDGYALTAIPVVACLLQIFDGEISSPGAHRQALAVHPRRFLEDIHRMGAATLAT
jgi:hypothetical protein